MAPVSYIGHAICVTVRPGPCRITKLPMRVPLFLRDHRTMRHCEAEESNTVSPVRDRRLL